MDTKTFQRFLENLRLKKQGLMEWLTTTPENKRRNQLGTTDEQAVQQHLAVIDDAISKAENKTLGLCEVCHDYVETSRLEMDFTASVCIEHYSDEQRRQLESELELSRKLQKALLPQEAPHIHGLQLAAFSQPAQIVGGDYFDFFHFNDASHGLAIADVMGKGLPASMLMASLQSSLRILVPENDSPAAVVRRLNKLFCHNIHLIRFITLFLGQYDSQSRVLKYCNAGHNPPLVIRQANGKTAISHWLKPTGAAIGLAESFNFSTGVMELAPGDVLVLYTDGVTEAMNSKEEQFGENRLEEIVRNNVGLSPQDLIKEIRRQVNDFTDNKRYSDDLTLVVAKVET
jgi:sigma-B regulation protein RsbU (phosphoserine phosphatase)